MDSLSQFVLGAAVGGVVLGRRAGIKAVVWGGVVATIPDLDVLVPLGDDVSNFTYHRSASHSVFVLTLLAPLLAWGISRLHRSERDRWRGWLVLVWLALITHVLLDCFTVYGTQIFWPIAPTPVAWSTIFIIDPLYTIWLLIAVLTACAMRRRPQRIRAWSIAGLIVSSAYLGFTVAAKLHVNGVVEAALERKNIPHTQYLTVPTPFNTLLWRVLVMDEGGYYEGFYSLCDPDASPHLTRYDSHPELLAPVQDVWAVQRLQWFTRGFYRVEARDQDLTITDLRMGQEPLYVFTFKVAELRDGEIVPVPNRALPTPRADSAMLSQVWKRIWRDRTACADSLSPCTEI